MTPGMWQWCCCGSGNIAISWDDTANKVVRVAELYGGQWRYEEAAMYSASYIRNCGITYDNDGVLHILYAESIGSGLYKLYWLQRIEYGLGYTSHLVAPDAARIFDDVNQATLIAHSTNNITVIYMAGATSPYKLRASVYNEGVWTSTEFNGIDGLSTNATQYGSNIYVFGYITPSISTLFIYGNGTWTTETALATGNTLTKCNTGLMWTDPISVLQTSHDTYVYYGMPAAYNHTTQLSFGTNYMKYFVQPFELPNEDIICAAGLGTYNYIGQAVYKFNGLNWVEIKYPTLRSQTQYAFLRSRCTKTGVVHSVYAKDGDVIYSVANPTAYGGSIDIIPSAEPYYYGTDIINAPSVRLAVYDSLSEGVSV